MDPEPLSEEERSGVLDVLYSIEDVIIFSEMLLNEMERSEAK